MKNKKDIEIPYKNIVEALKYNEYFLQVKKENLFQKILKKIKE